MKIKNSLYPILVFSFFFVSTFHCQAQNENYPWQISLGINTVDVYPTGVSEYGALFEDFFNVRGHWNVGTTPFMVQALNYLGRGFSFGGRASYNTITHYGARKASEPFYNADGVLKYNWNQLLKSERFAPYFEMGGGYAIFDAVGAGYFNLGIGIEYWFGQDKRTGVVLGSLYRNTGETYGVKHFQHHLSVAYRLEKRDKDNDGVVNRVDQCPDEPGFVHLNGCPDRDQDGIRDSEDRCTDVSGVIAFAGCPDSDLDGIPDIEDHCPKQPGIQVFRGCPDSDGDGIEDAFDACVEEPGNPENDGCPEMETEDPILEALKEVVYETKLIFFDIDKVNFSDKSMVTLNAIATLLIETPSLKVKIKGHTDNSASETYNQKLSEKRALAAKNYLILKNIDPSRIETVGLGETEPARANDSEEGKAYNRRVEFIIIK